MCARSSIMQDQVHTKSPWWSGFLIFAWWYLDLSLDTVCSVSHNLFLEDNFYMCGSAASPYRSLRITRTTYSRPAKCQKTWFLVRELRVHPGNVLRCLQMCRIKGLAVILALGWLYKEHDVTVVMLIIVINTMLYNKAMFETSRTAVASSMRTMMWLMLCRGAPRLGEIRESRTTERTCRVQDDGRGKSSKSESLGVLLHSLHLHQ